MRVFNQLTAIFGVRAPIRGKVFPASQLHERRRSRSFRAHGPGPDCRRRTPGGCLQCYHRPDRLASGKNLNEVPKDDSYAICIGRSPAGYAYRKVCVGILWDAIPNPSGSGRLCEER